MSLDTNDAIKALEALERLMATDGWQALAKHFQEQQLSISRTLVAAEADVTDFAHYHALAAEHRAIGKVITWPAVLAEQLRRKIEAEGDE